MYSDSAPGDAIIWKGFAEFRRSHLSTEYGEPSERRKNTVAFKKKRLKIKVNSKLGATF